MDRCAIFVDAGYLFAAGGELCCGTRARRGLRLEAESFVNMLETAASDRSGLQVLRTYWYDGAKQGLATTSQQRIAALANVKLRLGRLNARGEQKGVDALIYRDLMTLGRERAIADAFLLSGDDGSRGKGSRKVENATDPLTPRRRLSPRVRVPGFPRKSRNPSHPPATVRGNRRSPTVGSAGSGSARRLASRQRRV
jgi:hypothetical protein